MSAIGPGSESTPPGNLIQGLLCVLVSGASILQATWNVEKEVNVYFCKHTIEEIRKIEQNTRLLVEQKKEDLRQMVGCVRMCACACAYVYGNMHGMWICCMCGVRVRVGCVQYGIFEYNV